MTTPAGCTCPLERKVLVQTMEAIVSALSRDNQTAKRCQSPKKSPASENLPCVQSGRCLSPAAECKSSELRAGVFLTECTCLKRDGLQTACRRFGCGDRCGFVRPARRVPLPLGTAVAGYSLRPTCCPGHKQAERLQFLEEQGELRKRRPPSPTPPDPPPLPPPPVYKLTGLFPHVCSPDRRCPPRRPSSRMPCGGASCKHWSVPQPCTLPVCRAHCFENPPGWPTLARC